MNLDLRNLAEDNLQRMLSPNDPNVAVNIPAGQWHSNHATESGSVVLSVKDGKWEPLGAAASLPQERVDAKVMIEDGVNKIVC